MSLFKERTIICLTVAAVLLVAAVWLRPYLPKRGETITGVDQELFWQMKKYKFKNANLLFMGSSRTYRGVSPDDLGRHLSKSLNILNFGFSSGKLNPEMYQEASKILLTGRNELRAVVLEISPELFEKRNKHYSSIKKQGRIKSYRKLMEPFNARVFESFFDGRIGHYYEHYYANGWVACTYMPPEPMRNYRKKLNAPDQDSHRCLEANFRLFLNQVREWRRNGVLVFGHRLFTPSNHNIDFNFGFDEERYLARFREAGGIWLDVDYEGLYCYDGSHMDEQSARLYSRRLGKALSGKLKTLRLNQYVSPGGSDNSPHASLHEHGPGQ